MKWTTVQTWVDTETGETLKKHQIENSEYIILNKKITTKFKNNEEGTRHITYQCERNRQARIQFN